MTPVKTKCETLRDWFSETKKKKGNFELCIFVSWALWAANSNLFISRQVSSLLSTVTILMLGCSPCFRTNFKSKAVHHVTKEHLNDDISGFLEHKNPIIHLFCDIQRPSLWSANLQLLFGGFPPTRSTRSLENANAFGIIGGWGPVVRWSWKSVKVGERERKKSEKLWLPYLGFTSPENGSFSGGWGYHSISSHNCRNHFNQASF